MFHFKRLFSIIFAFAFITNEICATTPTLRTSVVRGAVATSKKPTNKSGTSVSTNQAKTTGGRLSAIASSNIQTNVSIGKPITNRSEKELENLYNEIDEMRDAVEESLSSYKEEIELLKAEIAQKDDRITELETSLESYESVKKAVVDLPKTISDEIESRGFMTAENFAADIENVKAATIAEVKQMNFATNNAVDTAIRAATTNIKSEIINERDQVLRDYAKTADVTNDIDVAKNATLVAAKQYVTDSNFATVSDLNNIALDEVAVANIVGNKLAENKVVTESSLMKINDIATIKQTLDKIPTVYATAAALKATTDGLNTTIAGLDNKYATSESVHTIIAGLDGKYAPKDKDGEWEYVTTKTLPNVLPGDLVRTDTITELDTRFVLRDGLANDVAGLKTETGEDIFVTPTGLDRRIASLGDTYATKAEVNTVDGKFANISNTIAGELLDDDEFKGTILAGLDENIKTLPGTVSELTGRLDEMDTTIAGLAAKDDEINSEFKGWKDTVVVKNNFPEFFRDRLGDSDILKDIVVTKTDLNGRGYATNDSVNNRFNNLGDTYATKAEVNTVNGKFTDYVTNADLNGRGYATNDSVNTIIAGLDGKYAPKDKDGEWEYVTTKTLPNVLPGDLVRTDTITKLDNRFVLSDGLASTIAGLKTDTGEDIFVTNDKIKDYATNDSVNNRFNSLGDTYATNDSVNSRFNSLGDTYATKATVNTVDGKFADYVTDTDLNGRGYVTNDGLVAYLSNKDNLTPLVTGLGDIFVRTDGLADAGGSIFVTPNALDNRIATLGQTYATKVEVNTVDNKVSGLSGSVETLNTGLSTLSGNYRDLGTTVGNQATDISNLSSGLETLQANAITKSNLKDNLLTQTGQKTTLLGDALIDTRYVNFTPLESALTTNIYDTVRYKNRNVLDYALTTPINDSTYTNRNVLSVALTTRPGGTFGNYTTLDHVLGNNGSSVISSLNSKVSNNTSAISTNAGNISSHESRIAENESNIDNHETRIEYNEAFTNNIANSLTCMAVDLNGLVGTNTCPVGGVSDLLKPTGLSQGVE
ncbi:MAG: hypothetical protein R8M37_01945 [Alphaproteobacteria bacterium]|nr:hypothetical protein [Alphaproteobacteria bacterium]